MREPHALRGTSARMMLPVDSRRFPPHNPLSAGRPLDPRGVCVASVPVLKPGDELAIRAGEFEWVVEVKALSRQRGPAGQALPYPEEEP